MFHAFALQPIDNPKRASPSSCCRCIDVTVRGMESCFAVVKVAAAVISSPDVAVGIAHVVNLVVALDLKSVFVDNAEFVNCFSFSS